MTVRPKFAFINGQFVSYAQAVVPIDDRGLQFGESLYEVLPVTSGRPRLLAEHVARMERGARELALGAGVPTLPDWEALVEELVAREGAANGLLYAQVTGGSAARDHVPRVDVEKSFFAYITPFRFPGASDVARGIHALTVPDVRWGRRDLKTTMLLPAVLAKREARQRGGAEAILLGPDGEVHEGASSNVFLVEGGSLVTPALSMKILPGTMRGLILELAGEVGLEVREQEIDLERLRRAREVFVSSTSLLAMPIVALDGVAIGSGEAGPVAQAVAERLRRRFELPA